MRLRLSIRTKLAASIIVPMVVVVSAIVYAGARRELKNATEILEQQIASRAQALAARLDEVFRAAARSAALAGSYVASDQQLTDAEVYGIARATVQVNPLVFGSCIAFAPFAHQPGTRLFAPYVYRDPQGPAGALREKDLATGGYDYTDPKWEWYREPTRLGTAVWTEPYFDEGGGNVVMCTHAVPFLRNGVLAGVATVDVRLEDIHPLELEGALPGEELAIISRKGTLLSFPDRDAIMRWSMFTVAERFRRPDIAELGRQMIAGRPGLLRLADLERADRIDIVAFAPIPSTGWSVYTSLDERQVLAPVYRHLWTQLLWGLIGITVITLVLLVVSVRITRPIRRLSRAVGELSSGNLEAHADDFHLRDEVGDLARGFNTMTSRLREQVQQLTRVTAQRQAAETELKVAREIQLSMLPRRTPTMPGAEVFGTNDPARWVGGDFYDWFELPGGRIGLVIADVSGKGVPAAMVMSVTRMMLREILRLGQTPAQTLSTANALLSEDNDNGMFVSAFLAVFDPSDGTLIYGNAGHPQPLRIAAGRPAALFGQITGPVLGAAGDSEFSQESLSLARGESLLLYTDGVTEARDPGGRMYGEQRLVDLINRGAPQHAAGIAAFVREAIVDYQRGVLVDDLTIVVLTRCAASPAGA